MKFMTLFKKELREMLSRQTIMVMVISLVALVFAGQAMTDAIEDSTESMMDIVICDQDQSEFSDAVLTAMESQLAEYDGKVIRVELESDDYAKELDRLDQKSVVIIPPGFQESVEKNEAAQVKFVQRMTSLSAMSNISTGSDIAVEYLSAAVKSVVYGEKVSAGTMTVEEVANLENPIALEETTVVGDKSEGISSSIVVNLCSAQTMLVPIILFVVIIFSSQMIINGVSTEKVDKTLETLLSAPVSRLSVICAKMLSAAIVAALQAAVYMVGMQKMMSGLTSGGSSDEYAEAIKNLGLTMDVPQYLLVGIQIFLSILIALSISLILGVLAKDAKSAQTLVLPIQFCTMIPYLLSMFMDMKTATPVLRYIVYAIPFSHSFMASENTMFGNWGLYIGGAVYQLVLLVVCLTIALRIFLSDRIFTMTLGEKKRKGAAPAEE